MALALLYRRSLTTHHHPASSPAILEVAASPGAQSEVREVKPGDVLASPPALLTVPKSVRPSGAARVAERMTTSVTSFVRCQQSRLFAIKPPRGD